MCLTNIRSFVARVTAISQKTKKNIRHIRLSMWRKKVRPRNVATLAEPDRA